MITKIILALILITATSTLFSQNFQGKAVYKSQRTLNMNIGTDKIVNDENRKLMNQQIQSQKDYTLKFDQKESLYTENEKLETFETPKANKGGLTMAISRSNNILYKNTANQTFSRQLELFGKNFLVKDSLKKPDWKLESDTKMIGKYTANKATLTRKTKERVLRSNEDKAIEVTKERITTVWYTPEIPINQGPGEYWGLPGLILEVQEEDFSLLCTDIIINPTEKFEIEIPKRGKVVTKEEYENIQSKMTKEVMERKNISANGDFIFIPNGG